MGQAGSKQEMFWEACGFGRAHLVEKFIEHGINVNWVSSVHACSPIHVASQGKPDVVRLLIGAGCDLSAVDSRGNTAAHHAAMQGHADIIQMLAHAGANLDSQDKNGWTPLHCAAYYAHLKAVDVLLLNKCATDLLNKDGRSALVETARSKRCEDENVLGKIAKNLIEAGCDVDLKCTDLGEADFTALMFAAYHNHGEVARALIQHGCDLNAASCYSKWTALHWAADRGNAEMVNILLAAGADPTRAGMRGELASSRAGSRDIQECLDQAVRAWGRGREVVQSSLSCVHSINAQASLDTARALESLSSHAKNRDILSVRMPTIPALGISSRSDPKIRYAKRSVSEVAIRSATSAFHWRSYSKQGSPGLDKDGGTKNVLAHRMFPLQDDKTNAFMGSLAERISFMTNRIANMSNSVIGLEYSEDKSGWRSSSDGAICKKVLDTDDTLEDSGLSTLGSSGFVSELATPDDFLANMEDGFNQSPSKYPSSLSAGTSYLGGQARSDVWNDAADASIFEANNRGFSILHALQERYRRSVCLEDVPGEAFPAVDVASKPEVMTQV